MEYNQFKWIDTFLKNFTEGRRFYSELFGWRYTDQYDNENLVYSLASLQSDDESLNGAVVAGVGPCAEPLPGGVPWNWGVYVLVHSVDATINRVTAAGGRVCKGPMKVMKAGHMAVCLDPGGTVIHLWQPLTHAGADVDNVPGAVCWIELTCTNVQQAKAFYGDVFGWSVQEVSNRYWQFMADGTPVGGMHTGVEQTGGQAIWLPYFRTVELDVMLVTCRRLGGKVVFGPRSEPGMGRFAVLSDLEGNHFGLAEFESDASSNSCSAR